MRTKTLMDLYVPAPKLNQLHILQQVGGDPDITQAELAERCALSVAMVNNYMKELRGLGLIEYRRKNSKSVSYHLTAAGRDAIDATQEALLQELARLFERAKEQVLESILRQAHGGLHRVVVYGSGALAEIVFHALESAKVSSIEMCSTDPSEVGQEWCGRRMIDPSQIRFMAPDVVVIALPQISADLYRDLARNCQDGTDLVRLDCQTPESKAIIRELAAESRLSPAAVR